MSASAQAKDAPRSFHVGIFFVTDRNAKKREFGGSRRYLVNCTHWPYYGQAFPLLRNFSKEEITSEETNSGWTVSKRKHESVSRKTLVKAAGSEESEKRFFLNLKAAVDRSSKKELYIFVHGYCTPFELAAEKAAELSYYSKQPAVLYSWPSVGKLFSYAADEGNVEWSLEHFRNFITNLSKYHVTEPRKVNLVAHSIGNRLLIWSGDELVKSDLLNQIVLSSPDVDSETFKHYALRYRSQGSANGYVLVSFKDDALPISQLVHGGYFRLGEGIGSILNLVPRSSELLDIPDKLLSSGESDESQPDLDDTKAKIKSSDDAVVTSASSTSSITSTTAIAAAAIAVVGKSNFRLIDFTELDKGLIGHSIPSQLIVNLCETGKPGDGLTFAPAVREKNFIAGFSRKAFKLLGTKDRTSQSMERVVYLKDVEPVAPVESAKTVETAEQQ